MKTVWVDANVLLRLFTGTPGDQAARAAELVGKASDGHLCLRISLITVAEMVWVLHRFYQVPVPKIAATLSEFLCSDGVSVESRESVLEALSLMAREGVDFADALLAVQCHESNEPVASFDEDFKRLGVQRYPI
ncbi:MAG: PIN domain-containing protein [Acidobacteriota bacterium]